MKKIFLIASLAIAVAGCNKDETTKPVQPQNASMAEQVATVIKKADIKLYKKIYGEVADAKAPKVGVDICRVYFIFQMLRVQVG